MRKSAQPRSNPLHAVFSSPDLRKKILGTLGIIALYRLGTAIPAPGVSYGNIHQCLEQIDPAAGGGVYSVLDLFSGGALLQLSIFALGITPYITASIIIQLLTVVVPRFGMLQKEGQSGQHTLTQYTRYLTIALAVLQATGIVALADRGQLFVGCPLPIIPDSSVWQLSIIVVVMTAGTAVVMWLGEQITDRCIGNGMSLLIFTAIAARIPAEGSVILLNGGLVFAAVCVFAVAIIASVVFVEQGQRRIPVQYARRVVGRRSYGGTSTYLPLKVNQAGVVPVIFGSSLLYLPVLVSQVSAPADGGHDPAAASGFQQFVQVHLADQSNWVYIAFYVALIIFFTYFYVGITFDPAERADEMRQRGGFIPGVRPGHPTAGYLRYVLSRITFPGSLYLGVVAALPTFFLSVTGPDQNQNFPLGGTAVLIMVGVGIDTVKQINGQLVLRSYDGFLR